MYTYFNKETDENDLPRERLEKSGLQSLSDTILIKLMLGICNENEYNNRLINDVSRVLTMNDDLENIFKSLKSIKGIKTAKASGIVAGFELFRRKLYSKNKITKPNDCYKLLEIYANEKQEHFIMLALNAANEVISKNVVSIGLANQAIIHAREIFSRAIEVRAINIIIAHNHPSGNTKPSDNDINTTKKLIEAGKIVGINVLDHVIIGEKEYYSFAENSKELFL